MAGPRYWEDFTAGQVYDLGTVELTAEEIVAFARQWDPQPFHTDPEAAAASPFGGLVASGWHTACALMRRYVDAVLSGAAAQGSPGIEQLRWRKPVRPGVPHTAALLVTGTSPSSTRADRGTVHLRWELTDPDGDLVLEMAARGLFGRRPAAGAVSDPGRPAR